MLYTNIVLFVVCSVNAMQLLGSQVMHRIFGANLRLYKEMLALKPAEYLWTIDWNTCHLIKCFVHLRLILYMQSSKSSI